MHRNWEPIIRYVIVTFPKTFDIGWRCEVCGDEGVVSGLEKLIWDMLDTRAIYGKFSSYQHCWASKMPVNYNELAEQYSR